MGQGLVQFGDPTVPNQLHLYSSSRDYSIVQEDFGARYTKIPFTVLFTDARFRQEWIDHYELDSGSPDFNDFLRDTDATVNLTDVRTGFTVSPWRRVSFEGMYRYGFERTDYDHPIDLLPALIFPTSDWCPGMVIRLFFGAATSSRTRSKLG